jgi:hypothetical protein
MINELAGLMEMVFDDKPQCAESAPMIQTCMTLCKFNLASLSSDVETGTTCGMRVVLGIEF